MNSATLEQSATVRMAVGIWFCRLVKANWENPKKGNDYEFTLLQMDLFVLMWEIIIITTY